MTSSLTNAQVAKGPNYSQLRHYFATAKERHLIHKRRIGGSPQPWTIDPIFRQYRFCNIDREYDKVTIWLRENWREPYSNHPNLAFSMALARLINWPPTLEAIGFPKRWNPNKSFSAIKARRESGLKVYTAAYLLGAIPKGADKAEYLIYNVLDPIQKELYDMNLDGTLQDTWEWFREHRGIGDFLAYEIVTDLRHTHHLRNAPDIMTWANAGPGALRGLVRMWGYVPRARKTKTDDNYRFPKNHANTAMQLLLNKSRDMLPKEMQPWEMRHVEHWLCEWDKYERVRLAQGTLDRFSPMKHDQWTREERLL